MRIALGGISPETSSFAKVRTTRADFESGFGLFRGHEALRRFTGANIDVSDKSHVGQICNLPVSSISLGFGQITNLPHVPF